MSAATPEQAALRLAVITEVREAASCTSDDGDECEKCARHADAILAAVAASKPHWTERLGPVVACEHEQGAVPGDGERLAIALAALRQVEQDSGDYSARATAEEALSDIADLSPRLHPQPAPELAAVLDGLESAALKGQVSGLLAVLSSLPVLAAEWEADAKGLDEDNRAAGAQEWTYRAAQLRECAASLRELAGGLS